MTSGTRIPPGTVYLVGAGPGDPGLLTLRSVECLAGAEVVLYDYLVNPAALEHARPTAELVPLGRTGRGRVLSPDEITARMIQEAHQGRSVVRLKGGDPSVFGRAADETAALREAGVPFEIVPGITTGLAVAAYCEIPITQQDDASAVALVAARERDAKTTSTLDYDALAAFGGTLVLYMGVGRVGEWSRALIERGKAPQTPVAIVRWCTRARQELVRCTLATAEETVDGRGLRPPAVFVVGDVVDRAPVQSWFSARPLFGTRVLVPGSRATSRKLRRGLAALGAEVLMRPALRIEEPSTWGPVDACWDAIQHYDWVVFASANGVDSFLGRLFARGQDVRRLGGVRLAAMGSGTADRLAHYHLSVDLVPDEFVAESLASALTGESRGRRILLVRGGRGRNVLARALDEAGAVVDSVVAYVSRDAETPDPDVAAALAAGELDWVTVTSGLNARALTHLYGAALDGVRFASIGPIASAALRELGHDPAVEAEPHTTAGLVDAILGAEQVRRGPVLSSVRDPSRERG